MTRQASDFLANESGRSLLTIVVRCATTANGTLATAFANGQTVDGVTLATGDLVLLKNQSTGAERGVYRVKASGAPARIDAMQEGSGAHGVLVSVCEGTTNKGVWQCQSAEGSDVVGTDSLSFVQVGTGASPPFDDATAIVKGSGDATKLVRIEADGITTGTTRVVTVPDQDVDLTPNTGTFPAATHASRHQSGGTDAIKLDDLASPDDNTDLDATVSAHGLMPKADKSKLDGIEAGADVTDATNVAAAGAAMAANNLSDLANAGTARTNLGLGSLATVTPTGTPDGTKFLRDDNAWAAPPGGSGDVATDAIWDAKGDLAAGTGANTASKLTVGSDGDILRADSGETTGLIWETPTTVSLPGLQFLLYNTETASSEHNTSTAESSALGTYTLPANSYDYIKIEAIIRLRAEEDAASKSDFTIRFYEGATLRRTYTARIIENSTAGIDSGGRMTTTLSTIITGGQGASSALTVTVQPSRSNANIGALCEAFRVYGIKDEALEAVQGPQGPAGADGGVITVLPIAVPTALTGLALTGGASISTDETGGRRLVIPDDTPNWKAHGEYEAVPTAPWEKRLLLSWPHTPATSELAGIMVRHSDQRLLTFGIHANPTPYYYGTAWTNETTLGSAFLANGITDAVWRVGWLWFHVGDDGAGNLYWGVSKDGKSIGPSTGTSLPGYTSIAKASYFDPGYVGWFGASNGGGLLHFTNQSWETVP